MSPARSTAIDERLRSLLLDGDFGSSGRLPSERELAERLDVSRPALREALGRAAEVGIVEIRRGAGAFLTPVDLADLAVVRAQLEPLAARLAAEHRTAEQVDELRGVLDGLRDAVDDQPAFAAGDAAVHRILAAASGNPVLARTLASLDELATYSRATTAVDTALRARTLRHLEALVDHVAAGRAEEAAAVMRRHLADIAATLFAPAGRRA